MFGSQVTPGVLHNISITSNTPGVLHNISITSNTPVSFTVYVYGLNTLPSS